MTTLAPAAEASTLTSGTTDQTKMRNVRVGRAWEDGREQTATDRITLTDVVRAALADYLQHRRAGTWPSWLPRP